MSRSVYVPGDAAAVAYVALDNKYYEDFDDWLEILGQEIEEALPSLKLVPSYKRSYYAREGVVISENQIVQCVVSEYCGLVSVSLVPKSGEPYCSLGWGWALKVESKFQNACGCVGEVLVSKGYASNGEQFFTPKCKSANKGELGLGFTSKEGWL